MVVYLDLVMGLNFGVDFLLLLGTNHLAGFPPGYGRTAAAAALGAALFQPRRGPCRDARGRSVV